VSDLHTDLAYLTIALNALAALIGLVAWLVHKNPKPFWWTLRAGQVLVMLEAVIGATLSLTGHDLPRLHLIYGLTPIVVSLLAEQLRIAGGDPLPLLREAPPRIPLRRVISGCSNSKISFFKFNTSILSATRLVLSMACGTSWKSLLISSVDLK